MRRNCVLLCPHARSRALASHPVPQATWVDHVRMHPHLAAYKMQAVNRDRPLLDCFTLHLSFQAVGKTFEVRRGEALDQRGRAMTSADFTRMFLRLSLGEQSVT